MAACVALQGVGVGERGGILTTCSTLQVIAWQPLSRTIVPFSLRLSSFTYVAIAGAALRLIGAVWFVVAGRRQLGRLRDMIQEGMHTRVQVIARTHSGRAEAMRGSNAAAGGGSDKSDEVQGANAVVDSPEVDAITAALQALAQKYRLMNVAAGLIMVWFITVPLLVTASMVLPAHLLLPTVGSLWYAIDCIAVTGIALVLEPVPLHATQTPEEQRAEERRKRAAARDKERLARKRRSCRRRCRRNCGLCCAACGERCCGTRTSAARPHLDRRDSRGDPVSPQALSGHGGEVKGGNTRMGVVWLDETNAASVCSACVLPPAQAPRH